MDYYTDLSQDYDVKIRQLVPGYDEMVACITRTLERERPSSILEIGSGVGNLAEAAVQAVDYACLTAVEVSADMMARAKDRLSANDRVTFVHANIIDFVSDRLYGAIYSNLVLHNISHAPKLALLSRIREWLEPNGIFVWGDLIRHEDPEVQDRWVRTRIEHARASGCSDGLIERNFEKEGTRDFPLTEAETIDAAADAGFDVVRSVWAQDTFAVFLLGAST